MIYQRNVEHCEVTKYAKEVSIKEIIPAENSDNLVILKFNELGWQAISRVDKNYAIGDKVFFIPVDTVIPFELSEKLQVTTYLKTGKVAVTKLRGNTSEGLIVDKAVVEPYLDHLIKWEDLPTVSMGGEVLAQGEISPMFEKFYKMPNIKNEPDTFAIGEDIFWSEKIHGTNARFGMLPHPVTGEQTLYIGGHEQVFNLNPKNEKASPIYITTIGKEIEGKTLPENTEFFCEIYGMKIQHLNYGENIPKLKVFAIIQDRKYLTPSETVFICKKLGLPYVEFSEAKFNISELEVIADADSTVAIIKNNQPHIREGIVIRSATDGHKMAKLISTKYLGGKSRTERH